MHSDKGSLNHIDRPIRGEQNQGIRQHSRSRGRRTVLAAAIAMLLASNMAAADTISSDTSNYTNGVDEDITVDSGVTVSGTLPVNISTAAAYGSNFINNGTLTGSGPGNPGTSAAALQFLTGIAGSGLNNGSISFTAIPGGPGTTITGNAVFIDGVLDGTFSNVGSISVIATNSGPNANATTHGINVESVLSGVLSNAGSLSAISSGEAATAYAMFLANQVSGQVVNTGALSASATGSNGIAFAAGIQLNDDMSGLLSNTGTVDVTANGAGDATATGVGIDGNLNGASMVSNAGTINATATSAANESTAYGLNLNDRLNSGAVINSGSINAAANGITGDTNAYGLFVNDGTDIAMTNAAGGHISAIAIGQDVGSADIASGIFLQNDISATGSVTNAGSIIAKADGGAGNAVGISVGSDMAGSLSNSGTIDVSASGFRTGGLGTIAASAFGIFVLGDVSTPGSGAVSGLLTNSGTINVSATSSVDNAQVFAAGVLVNNLVTGGRIDNTGTIGATAQAGANASNAAVGITVDNLSGVLQNEGSISASLNGGGAAAGLLVVNLDGVVNNAGVISGAASAGGQAYSVQVTSGTGGAINNLAGGKLIGGLQILSTGITVNNAGTLMLKNGVDLANVQNTGTIAAGEIDGDYNQSATGVLHIAADGAGTGGYSKLTVGGTANIAGNAFVDVKQINTLAIGETLSGVVSAGTLVGNFADVMDNSAMFNFKSIVNGNDLDFVISRGITAYDAVVAENNRAATGAAMVIDRFVDNGTSNPDTQAMINAFGNLGTQRQVSDAVSQTLPLITASMTQVAANTLSSINRVVRARQDGFSGLSTGESYLADKNIWVKPFGSWANQGDRNGVSGYDANTYGAVFGADADISGTSRAGLAFAYARSNVDSNSSAAPQTADINTYQLIAYGSHSLSDTMDVSVQADVGQNKNDGRRTIDFGGLNGVATSSYDSWSGHVGAGLAHTIKLSDQTIFTPSVRADYTSIQEDAYQESGVAALNVDKTRAEAFVLGVDGKLWHAINRKASLTANLGVGYDVINDGASVTAAFAGEPSASFTTNGIDPSPWLARGGIGIVGQITPSMQISANYDFEVRDNFNNQTASVKMLWAF
jgi:outer membrane autotransporter protein